MAEIESVEQISNNPVLQDIAEIKISRPELTPDEWVIVEKAAEYYKALLKPEVRQELEVTYAAQYDKFTSEANIKVREQVSIKFDEWKKAQEPLDAGELKKLLSQEYEEITFPILTDNGARSFTIRELPKSIEKRFITLAQKTVVPLMEEKALANFRWTMDSTMADKINEILRLIPNGLDLLADIAAICLDPFEKDKTINGKWVSNNIGSARIEAIVLLQFEVNKYRDFFLHGFRLFQNLSNKRTI